ncbi:MAG: bifunctional metallophosphatase/5'-nucleotidase [Rectinemataceae bacterium]
MKRLLGITMILALMVAGIGFAQTVPPLKGDVAITILHTNDMHSHGLPSATEIGYPRIAGYAADLKAQGKNVLLLDAGDTLHGMPWANLEKGSPVVNLMNLSGYAAMTTGNHDYNYGVDRLIELWKTMNFPILAANVYRNGEPLFDAYKIRGIGGVRVAIIGVATPETLYKADPAGLKGVVFENPVSTVYRLINGELWGRYDVLIVLSHLGIDTSSNPTSLTLAKACPEINLIIDGHSHSSLQQEITNNTTGVTIVSADSLGVALGRVDILVNAKRSVVSVIPQSVNLVNTPAMPADAAVKTAADGIAKAQEGALSAVVGTTAIELVGKREIVRKEESNLGRLIANGMLATTGADIALMNGGGIRESIPAGNITKKQVYTVLPFGNYLWTTVLSGVDLKAVLENGVSKLPAIDGRYPHLAGASFTFDAARPVGSRVLTMTVKGKQVFADGKFADEKAKYNFCTLNFEMSGGDEYNMLKGRQYKEFPLDADSFMAYVAKLGTITEENIVLK